MTHNPRVVITVKLMVKKKNLFRLNIVELEGIKASTGRGVLLSRRSIIAEAKSPV
jgi:hypothetical protein